MIHKSNNLPEMSDEKAKSSTLEFSPPECCYESIAHFMNEQGHQVIIRVSGFDESTVKLYTKQLSNKFAKVLPETEQENTKTEREVTMDIESVHKHITSTRFRNITEIVLDKEFVDRGMQKTYRFASRPNFYVLIKEVKNSVKAIIQGIPDGEAVPLSRLLDQPGTLSYSFPGTSSFTEFELTITGDKNTNQYTLDSNGTLLS
jgi:hypothetical protein